MTHADILQRVTEIIRDLAEDDDLALRDETVAHDIPAWDSLLNVRLIIAIESEFGVRFETAEISGAASPQNVGEMINLIGKKMN